ncbi:hypothetical protein [Laspinema olomoucense]|uniref:DUF2281 domain-containing protein n=1 Tax=Laspinema olomoucense D3b TaxID=2953688 RepID=A0ABT2N4I9_9CYAN|nr:MULTISPECIES: hypothetical protein [unclassified Laspinema]MCT7970870.1 hypothetical protein [Laspinema sp. D3d]MCT7976310.1 hypothetical protein [Laspinema sp. D3b]
MPNPPPIRQQLDRELDRLPPESLTQILAFARSLQPQTDYTTLWENWFAEVDTLPLDSPPPNVQTAPPNYSDYLVEKYRDQGLNL